MDELTWYKEQYLAWKETARSQSETIKMQSARITELTKEVDSLQAQVDYGNRRVKVYDEEIGQLQIKCEQLAKSEENYKVKLNKIKEEYESKISKSELSGNRLSLEEEKLNLRKVRECRAQINSYLEIVKELRRGSINKDQAIALGLPEKFFEIAEQVCDRNIDDREAYTLLRNETLIEMQTVDKESQ